MPTVEYTKKRSIVSGSLGDSEILEFRVQENTQADKPKTEELMTMGLAVSSVLESILSVWRVTTVPILYSASAVAAWREFFHSVAAREVFLYDPTGTEASPGDDIYSVTISPDTWTFSRQGAYMTISMEFQETSA